MRIKNSIIWKMLVWLLLLALIPLGVAVIFNQRQVNQAVRRNELQAVSKNVHILAVLGSDNPEMFNEFTRSLGANEKSAFILGTDGIYLAHSDHQKIGTPAGSDFPPEILQTLLSGKEGTLDNTANGQMIGYAPVAGQEAFAVLVRDSRTMEDSLRTLSNSIFLQLSVTLLITTLISGLAVMAFINPLRYLIVFADQLGSGNMDATIVTDELEGEIADLGGSLNNMAARLRELIGSLEQRITEREQAEQALQRSESLLSKSQEIAHVGSWELDLKTNHLTWSDEVYRILGLARHEFAATYAAFLETIPPEDRQTVDSIYSASVREGKDGCEIEHRVVRRHTDEVRIVYEKCVHIRDATGVIIQSIGMMQDITERKQTEEALCVSEERFSRAISGTGAGLWDWDMVQNTVFFSSQWKSMLGYQDHEIENDFSGWKNLWHAEDAASIEKAISDYLEGRTKTYEIVHRLRHKNGSWRWILTRGDIHRDATGKPLRWTGTNIDITERIMIEEKLRESEERFKSLHNASFGGIAIHDKGIILECNHGLSEMMGYSEEELLGGMDGLLLIAPDSRELVRHHIITGYEKPYEAFGLRKNGEIFPMRLEARNVPYKGKNVRTVEFRDITAQKLAEEKIREDQVELQRLLAETEYSRQALLSVVEDQKETQEQVRQLNAELEQRVQDRTAQLSAINQELEAFSYSVSHDLRAPLRALNGFSGALISDYQEILDEQGKYYLTRIQEASRRMGQLIDDLLNLSRISRREVNLRRVNLSQLAWDVFDELKALSPAQPVEINISADLIVQADPGLLKIAMENLMHNALKYSSKKEVALIQVGVLDQPGSEERVFYVRDNGAGFDMAYANKLFTPFQRLHGTNEYSGTGIGLTIVQRIITRHGGRIWSEAAVDQGATFYFTLG